MARIRAIDPPNPVFERIRKTSSIGRWQHIQSLSIIAYFEKHEGKPFELCIAWRHFGAHRYVFDRDIVIVDAEWRDTRPGKALVIGNRDEEVRNTNQGTLRCGLMQPHEGVTNVRTTITLSPTQDTTAEIAAPIQLDFDINPVSYRCPHC